MYIEPMIVNITITGSTSSPFTLQYGSSESTNLTASISASQFDSAVTAIIDGASGPSIEVIKSVFDDQTTFQVIFFEAMQRITTLQLWKYDSSFINVTIHTVQMGRFPIDLVLGLPNRLTDPVSLLERDSNYLRDQLYGLISVTCTKSPAGQVYWTHGYDGTTGDLWGTRDNIIDPQCGRYSLKNPSIIFYAGRSRDDITQQSKQDVLVILYNWVRIIHNRSMTSRPFQYWFSPLMNECLAAKSVQ